MTCPPEFAQYKRFLIIADTAEKESRSAAIVLRFCFLNACLEKAEELNDLSPEAEEFLGRFQESLGEIPDNAISETRQYVDQLYNQSITQLQTGNLQSDLPKHLLVASIIYSVLDDDIATQRSVECQKLSVQSKKQIEAHGISFGSKPVSPSAPVQSTNVPPSNQYTPPSFTPNQNVSNNNEIPNPYGYIPPSFGSSTNPPTFDNSNSIPTNDKSNDINQSDNDNNLQIPFGHVPSSFQPPPSEQNDETFDPNNYPTLINPQYPQEDSSTPVESVSQFNHQENISLNNQQNNIPNYPQYTPSQYTPPQYPNNQQNNIPNYPQYTPPQYPNNQQNNIPNYPQYPNNQDNNKLNYQQNTLPLSSSQEVYPNHPQINIEPLSSSQPVKKLNKKVEKTSSGKEIPTTAEGGKKMLEEMGIDVVSHVPNLSDINKSLIAKYFDYSISRLKGKDSAQALSFLQNALKTWDTGKPV